MRRKRFFGLQMELGMFVIRQSIKTVGAFFFFIEHGKDYKDVSVTRMIQLTV